MNSGTVPPWLSAIRRQDRRISDDAEVWRILDSGLICHVAFCSEGWPYIVPLSYGVVHRRLYFHCAGEGLKLDLLRANPNVCFEVEIDVEPAIGERLCEATMRYRSVIGFGQAAIVTDIQERTHGLQALVGRYVAHEETMPLDPDDLADVDIFRIDVCSLSGKASHGSASTLRS